MAAGGTAASRRIDGAAAARHAGGALVRGHQYRRRMAVPRRRGGPGADRAQQRRVGDELLADADPAVHPDGRDPVSHGPCHQGHRRRRASHPAGAGAACRGRRGGRHRVLRHLRLDHRHHSHAGLADAARDARARLPPDHGDRTDHGDRRGRHADPAVGADRAARQPVGDLDLQAADRRRRARPDPVGGLRRLHRRAGEADARARAADADRRPLRLGELAPAHALRRAADRHLRRGGRRHVGRVRNADRVGGAGRAGDHGRGGALSRAEPRSPDEIAQGRDRHLRHDHVHHPGRHDVLADPELLRAPPKGWSRPSSARACRPSPSWR